MALAALVGEVEVAGNPTVWAWLGPVLAGVFGSVLLAWQARRQQTRSSADVFMSSLLTRVQQQDAKEKELDAKVTWLSGELKLRDERIDHQDDTIRELRAEVRDLTAQLAALGGAA